MRTNYDKVTTADGTDARDRLVAKARPPEQTVRDIAKMHRRWRPRPKADEWQTLVEDTTEG